MRDLSSVYVGEHVTTLQPVTGASLKRVKLKKWEADTNFLSLSC